MSTEGPPRRPLWVHGTLLALAAVMFVSMVALGNWQMRRLSWKLDLIEQVEAYAHGAPVSVTPQDTPPDYQRVAVEGVLRPDLTQRVKGVTDFGMGHWHLTPLETAHGAIWVNRGFVPAGMRATELEPSTEKTRLTGLALPSVPGGTLLEKNNPETGRWVSIDLDAMSSAVGLRRWAGYYVAADAAGTEEARQWPRGGLTKLEFRNTHLSYALTWYAMAALFLGAMAFVIWERKRGER